MSRQTYKFCFCFRRRFRLPFAEAPEEIKLMFNQCSENGVMTVDRFHRFLIDVQKEKDVTLEQTQVIMDKLHDLRHPNIFHRRGLYVDEFFNYLFGNLNPPSSSSLGVHHDMTAPLSHYYIYTGHNSYLTGNQLSSDCSDVPIIKALQRGVRVIELDIWPSSSKGDIDVLHGRTLTSPVKLIKCLRSIKEYAFCASAYPLVITLEDHLTEHLQAKVAEMLMQTFGELLFCPDSSNLKELPSPESLKGRIIISTKPPKEYLEARKGASMQKNRSIQEDEEAWGKEVVEPKTIAVLDGSKEDDVEEVDDEDGEDRGDAASAYRRLIAIHAGKVVKDGLRASLAVDPDKVRRLSLSEHEVEKAAESHGGDVIRFTQKNILRVYPKGTRFNSSNYNPLIGWMHGAQMVAFNMQGYGRSLWMMHGMFKANGGCGYVKKPDFLLEGGDTLFEPKVKLTVKRTLQVTMYMGAGWHSDFGHTHFDIYSPPDFYARVGIAGVPSDNVMKKTKTIEDNWMPCWNEVFRFPLTVPELALLRIEVHEYNLSEKDDFGGQSCLPVSEIREGVRAVPLHDRRGEMYKSVKLLVHFEFI